MHLVVDFLFRTLLSWVWDELQRGLHQRTTALKARAFLTSADLHLVPLKIVQSLRIVSTLCGK